MLNFETLLKNFTSISTISLNFRTMGLVVTENLSEQNLGRRKKKKWKKMEETKKKNKRLSTTFGRLKNRNGPKESYWLDHK